MKIAIDLDNTINGSSLSIKFFSMLTNLLSPEHITILTNREPGTEKEIAEELRMLGISYSDIVITAEKADYILQNGIEVFFENEDEQFLSLPDTVLVCKVREDGNFDFAGKESRWVGSRKTVRLIDE